MDIFHIMEEQLKIADTFILIFLVLTLSSSFVQISTGATVGVKEGDWAKYKVTAKWVSDDPTKSKPTLWKDLESTESEFVTVQRTSGTNITILVTTNYINGTQRDTAYWGDITTNLGNQEFGFQVIPAGLSQGDAIRQSALQVNYTTFKEYAGQNREVNYAGVSFQVEGEIVSEYYWDRATGILCASRALDIYFLLGYRTETMLQRTIIATNLWQAQTPSQPTLPLLLLWAPPLVIGGIVVTFILIKQRSKPKRKRKGRI